MPATCWPRCVDKPPAILGERSPTKSATATSSTATSSTATSPAGVPATALILMPTAATSLRSIALKASFYRVRLDEQSIQVLLIGWLSANGPCLAVMGAHLPQSPRHRLRPMSADESHSSEVIVRSIELASQSDTELLTADQIRSVAAELQVPPAAVAAALAESQVDATASTGGLLDRLIGPDRVAVRHHTGIDSDETRQLIVRWLQHGYGLRVRTASVGTIVATKRKDIAGPVARVGRSWQGLGLLGSSREVRAALVEYDGDRTVLCLVADVSHRRRSSIAAGTAVSGAGVAAGAAAAAFAPMALFVAPVAVGVGAVVARRRHQAGIADIQEELEVTADGVAMGRQPPTLRSALSSKVEQLRASALGRVLPSSSRGNKPN